MRMHSSCIRTRGFLKKAAKKSRLEDAEHLANPLYEYPRRILQSCIFVMPRWCWGGRDWLRKPKAARRCSKPKLNVAHISTGLPNSSESEGT